MYIKAIIWSVSILLLGALFFERPVRFLDHWPSGDHGTTFSRKEGWKVNGNDASIICRGGRSGRKGGLMSYA